MNERKFISLMGGCILGLFLIYFTLLEVTNPHLTGFLDLKTFRPWQMNIEYAKFENLSKHRDIETAIIGSSTSEAYIPANVSKLFNTKAYSLSLGGADTPTRYAFFEELLESQPKLKRIIYVADFYEFNDPLAKAQVAFNDEMGAVIPSANRPGLLAGLQYYISNQMFEDFINMFKRRKKDKRIHINDDGTSFRSMVLSSIETKSGHKALFNEKEKAALSEYIRENIISYGREVLNDFPELHPDVISLYEKMATQAKSEDIELIFVMSPYHHDFKEGLFKIDSIPKVYKQWRTFLASLASEGEVIVIDNTDDFVATEAMSGVWRDGIHYNRETAVHFLKGARLSTENY